MKSIPKIFLKDVFNPFYIFQAFVIWFWCFVIQYYYFSAIIAITTILSVIL